MGWSGRLPGRDGARGDGAGGMAAGGPPLRDRGRSAGSGGDREAVPTEGA